MLDDKFIEEAARVICIHTWRPCKECPYYMNNTCYKIEDIKLLYENGFLRDKKKRMYK